MQLSTIRPARALPAAWIAALVLPSAVWVFSQTRAWTWDPAYYGYWALQLFQRLTEGHVGAWLKETSGALKMMPPLLVWLGQFFVPLRHLTGDAETALMLLNLGAATATLALLYRLTRSLGGSMLAGMAAAAVCGSANLFLGLSRHFLTEPLQGFTAALSMTVALHADKRSHLRNVGYVLILLALAFSAKSTSFIFVLPALTYMALAVFATWRDPRPAASRTDIILVGLGAVGVLITAIWYWENWRYMAMHFVQASVGAEVQNYRTATPYLDELAFWIDAISSALSLWKIAPAMLTVLALAALALAIKRLRLNRHILRDAVNSNALFGFYIAGMLLVSILAYAMQINHDPRFLTPIIPPIAGLVGWSLTMLRHCVLAVAVIIASLINSVAANALTFGHNVGAGAAWLWIADRTLADKNELLPAIALTCRSNEAAPVAVGVSYPFINSNSTSFYGAKYRLQTGINCSYTSPPQDSVKSALDWLDAAQIQRVLTVAPDKQNPADFANPIAKPFAEALAADPRFTLSPDSPGRFQIFQRVPPAGPP